jgi:hypothetical protein
MATPTLNYFTTNGAKFVKINSKQTVETLRTSAPSGTLDYKVDPTGNHLISINGAPYEPADMLSVVGKL